MPMVPGQAQPYRGTWVISPVDPSQAGGVIDVRGNMDWVDAKGGRPPRLPLDPWLLKLAGEKKWATELIKQKKRFLL